MAIPTFYSSTDTAAPTITAGMANWLSTILDACLVTGYGSKSGAGWTKTYQGTVGNTNTICQFSGVNYEALGSPSHVDFNIGTGDFTFEAWMYFNLLKNSHFLFDNRYSNSNSPCVYFDSSGQFMYYEAAANRITATAVVSTSTWYHVAVARASGVVRAFINGTQVGTSYTASTNFTSGAMAIGVDYAFGASCFNGYMEDFHYVKGTALYTANFTPSTAQTTAVGNTKLLLNFNGNHMSRVFTDSSTAARTVTPTVAAGSVFLTNQKAGPNGVLNPTTSQYNQYVNSSGRGIILESTPYFWNNVNAFNTVTSLTSGNRSFFHKDHGVNNYWSHPWANTSNTEPVEWHVAATDKFFYLYLGYKDVPYYNPVTPTGFAFSTNRGDPNSRSNRAYAFGTLSNLQCPDATDSILTYDTSVYPTDSLNALTSCHLSNRGNNAGISGIVYNALNGGFDYLKHHSALKYPSFKQAGVFSAGMSGASTISKPDPYIGLNIRSKSRHLMGLSNIWIGFYILGDYHYGIIGSLPGLYTYIYPHALPSLKYNIFNTISTKKVNGFTTKTYKYFGGLSGPGYQYGSNVSLFLDTGDWL